MTYFDKDDYSERYYVRFVDLDGNEWRISIMDPTDVFTPVELTGAANPIEWFGVGDESQTKVVCGSTGTLRLVCRTAEQASNIFVVGGLFPEVINDRRVDVTRKRMDGSTAVWDLIWQGFIKPEQYTQDWDSAPLELELPLVSPIAATEFFTMPEYNYVSEMTYIADLLNYVIGLLGCNINAIMTNKPIYEDFNGNTRVDSGGRPMHWTQGQCSSMYFYDFESDGIKPKTIKEVLETICYPYGKVNDCRDFVTIMMNAGKWIDGDNHIYTLVTDRISINYRRFVSDSQRQTQINLSDLQIASTENSVTLVAKPSSYEFSNKINVESDVYEMDESYIKSSLPCDADIVQDSSKVIHIHGNGFDKFTYHFSGDYVDQALYQPVYQYGLVQGTNDPQFCRVVHVETEDEGITFKYSLQMPLAFYIPAGGTIGFDVPVKIKSTAGMNKVKVSFDVYSTNYEGRSPSGEIMQETLAPRIIDATAGKYLDLSTRQWNDVSGNYTSWVFQSMSYLSDCKVTFNEPRSSSDNSLHTLRFVLAERSLIAGTPIQKMYVKITIEYVRDDTYTYQGVADTFTSTLQNTGERASLGSSGEAISVDFKTMCGRTSVVINGNSYAPANGFCDSQKYIDKGNRQKIELEAVKFNMDFVVRPFLVNDGNTVYVPVAFGMSPRDNIARITLVSTNLGLTPPTS